MQATLAIEHVPQHPLTLPGLGRIPRHGTHIAALGTGRSGPPIGSATAEKTARKEEKEGEALSHAGKIADARRLASVGIRREFMAVSSPTPTPAGKQEKDRWNRSTGLKDTQLTGPGRSLPGRGIRESHLVTGLNAHTRIDITRIQVADSLAGFHRVRSQPTQQAAIASDQQLGPGRHI